MGKDIRYKTKGKSGVMSPFEEFRMWKYFGERSKKVLRRKRPKGEKGKFKIGWKVSLKAANKKQLWESVKQGTRVNGFLKHEFSKSQVKSLSKY